LTCGREAIQELGTIAPDAGILTAKIQLFAAIRCRLLRPFRSNELGHRALEFLEPREADRMIRDSVIQDPCTLVALMRLLQPGSPLQKDR
ncbi:MAG: hypothetical protein GWO19_13955, partial [Nitrospinaceae bacterium]|nr:hypothetical protein [Nitrospinaceae bacterium]NIU97196.1 hypothetical protein [Nitrospinaceae bacterium]